MDKRQLGELILDSQETMYRVAKTLLCQDEDCMDAMQEAIVKAFAGIESLRHDRMAKTWLIRILINECYTLLRKKQKLVFLEDYAKPEKGREDRPYSELYEALERLSEPYRICVTLYYLEGYSVKETAALLDVPKSTVKTGWQEPGRNCGGNWEKTGKKIMRGGEVKRYEKRNDRQEDERIKRCLPLHAGQYPADGSCGGKKADGYGKRFAKDRQKADKKNGASGCRVCRDINERGSSRCKVGAFLFH